MRRNKKAKWRFLPEIFLIILAIIFFVSQIYNFNLQLAPENISLQPISLVDVQTISDSKKLNVCGDWPVENVELSPSRGNPFSKKEPGAVTVPNVSEAVCASFNQ